MTFREMRVASPIGALRLVAGDDALIGVYMEEHARAPAISAGGGRDHPVLQAARDQLAAWFRGERTRFELPIRPAGTPFQLAVWRELGAIPFGETRTYGWIAGRLGHPTACRAVGAANGHNPIAIVVPCHRVIGADGGLTGYAGGVERKRWLLEHERAVLGERPACQARGGGAQERPPRPATTSRAV